MQCEQRKKKTWKIALLSIGQCYTPRAANVLAPLVLFYRTFGSAADGSW